MAISVTDPIGPALNRTRDVLFAPFDFVKWLKLGFCAFLAHLGNSSGGGGSGNTGSWQEPGGSGGMERVTDWVDENWELVVTIGIVALLIIAAIWITILWLQGRGRFMFLDGVVRNRGAVVEPWKSYRAEGNSAFRFMLCLTFTGLVAMMLVVAIGVGIAWSDIQAEQFRSAAWAGLLVGGGLFLLVVVTWALIDMFLADFVVPAMYARRIGVMEAWGIVGREVFSPYVGQVVLYVLMKILISLVFASLVVALICATLCLAVCCLAIPYVGTVLLLPLLVFGRSYSLYFLDQFGGEWQLFSQLEEPGGALE